MKKNIKRIGVFAMLSTVLFTSCREDIVNIEPYSQVSETSAFSTPSLIALSVNGVYNAAQMGVYNGTEESPKMVTVVA